MTEHTYMKLGRYECTWNNETQIVTIWDHQTNHEVFTMYEEPSLSDVLHLINKEQGEVGPLTLEEITFLLDMCAEVETIINHAEHDLQRYEEIGVSG